MIAAPQGEEKRTTTPAFEDAFENLPLLRKPASQTARVAREAVTLILSGISLTRQYFESNKQLLSLIASNAL